MKTIRLIPCFLALACVCSLASRAAAMTPPQPISVALLRIETDDYNLDDKASQTAALLSAYLSTQDSLIIVERQQLDSLLGEQSLGASGLVNQATAAQIGQLTGAKVLLTGRLFSSGDDLTIVIKIIGTETGRVFGQMESISAKAKLSDGVQALGDKITMLLQTHSADLVAPAFNENDALARLQKLVAGYKLPSLTIDIPEMHLTKVVIDPAAETEMARLLGQAGVTLFDHASAEKADVRVTGSAFSEFALRHGDFISCRARVEIKVVDVKSGRILLQDRQTEVAADISEAVAAKTALQHAGGKLAERIAAALLNR
jgi:hypothetical protein